EMRIETRRRTAVEATDRSRARDRRSGGVDVEAQARSNPAGKLPAIERGDFLRKGRDEIVVERGIVVLDGRDDGGAKRSAERSENDRGERGGTNQTHVDSSRGPVLRCGAPTIDRNEMRGYQPRSDCAVGTRGTSPDDVTRGNRRRARRRR